MCVWKGVGGGILAAWGAVVALLMWWWSVLCYPVPLMFHCDPAPRGLILDDERISLPASGPVINQNGVGGG